MISFKIQAQAIASHAFVIPFNAGHGTNSDSVSMPPCDFPFPLIYYSVLSTYKIPASVGCKSADHRPGAAARSCQTPGGCMLAPPRSQYSIRILSFGNWYLWSCFFSRYSSSSWYGMFTAFRTCPFFVGDRVPEIYDNRVTALHIIIQHFCRDSFDLKRMKISPLFAILYGSFCRNVPLYVWKREKASSDFFPLFFRFFCMIRPTDWWILYRIKMVLLLIAYWSSA